MTPNEYQEMALRTLSHPDRDMARVAASFVPALLSIGSQLKTTENRADHIKRGVFYRKLQPKDVVVPKDWSAYYDQDDLNRLHAMLGIITEVGELVTANGADTYKFGRAMVPDPRNITEELGDLLWYIALMCHACSITMEDVMKLNIEKLQKRFPDRFDENLATNRDIENELSVYKNVNEDT